MNILEVAKQYQDLIKEKGIVEADSWLAATRHKWFYEISSSFDTDGNVKKNIQEKLNFKSSDEPKTVVTVVNVVQGDFHC